MSSTRALWRFRFLRAVPLMLAVVIGVGISTSPAPLAAPITYQFDSNASAVLAGSTYRMTGSFVVDPVAGVSGEQTYANITLIGPALIGTNTYTDTSSYPLGPGSLVIKDLSTTPGIYSNVFIQIIFTSSTSSLGQTLGLYSVDLAGFWNNPPGSGDLKTITVMDMSPTGSADPVPEPTSITLLGMALGLFLLGSRARSHCQPRSATGFARGGCATASSATIPTRLGSPQSDRFTRETR